MQKRFLATLGAASIAAATLLAPGGTSEASVSGFKWGAYPYHDGMSQRQALARIEGVAGRQMGVVRVFKSWGSSFPSSDDNWYKSTGRTIMLSVKPSSSWSSIASAQPGSSLYSTMKSWADRVRDFGAPIYVGFSHEPEAKASLHFGTSSQFAAAFRKWVSVFRAEGARNVKFTWIMTDWSFAVNSGDRRAAYKWYPGDAYVDAIGADAYNWYTCRGGGGRWKSLQQILEPVREFGLQHPGKELWLPEYGTVEDPQNAGRKAQWYRDAEALFKQSGWQSFRGASMFERADPAACHFTPSTSSSAASAWKGWGQDSYYSG